MSTMTTSKSTKTRRRHNTCLGILLVIALLLTSSCQQTDGTHIFLSTHSEGWAKNDTLTFMLPASPVEEDLDLQVELRIDKRYPYQDLWLVLEQTYETKRERERHSYTTVELKQKEQQQKLETFVARHQHYNDTLHLQLVDERKFTGSGRNLLVYRFPVRKVHLIQHEQGQVVVRHIMDNDTIPGIHNIGISFLPVEE